MQKTEYLKNITVVIIKVKEEKYVLEVSDIKEIYVPGEKVVPIPLADKAIVGMIDIRGEIYTIVSLRHKIFNNETEYKLNALSRILLLQTENARIALLIDSVVGVKELPESIFAETSTIVETNIDYRYIKSVGVYKDEPFILLNIRNIVQPYLIGFESSEEEYSPAPKYSMEEEFEEIPLKEKIKKSEALVPQKIVSKMSVTPKSKTQGAKSSLSLTLTKGQKDMLQEIGNIGSGNAVTALSRLINKKIDVNLTDVGIISFDKLTAYFGGSKERVCGIFCHIDKPSQSTIVQIFEMTPLMKMISSLMGKESNIDPTKVKEKKDLDQFAISTITEMGNILGGHYVSALADLTGFKMITTVPEFAMTEAGQLGEFLSKELESIYKFVVIIKTTLKIVDFKLSGIFFFIPDVKMLENLFTKLGIEHDSFKDEKGAKKIDKRTEKKVSSPKRLDPKDIKLTDVQRDALQEVGNIGAGNAANALAKMINKRVDINIPSVEMVELNKYADKISKKSEKLFVAWSNVIGKTKATVLSIFSIKDILEITSIIVEDKSKKKISEESLKSINDLPELYRSAMIELGHILGSHYASALGDLLSIKMMTEVPDMNIDQGKQLFKILKDEIGLLEKLSLVITTNVIITDIKITGTFLYIPEIETLQELLTALENFYK